MPMVLAWSNASSEKGTLIWIGNNIALQTKLIAAFHLSAIGGRSGVNAIYHRLKKLFIWKGMKTDMDSYIKQCSICQHTKHSHDHPAGLLQPLPIPAGVWQDMFMDFVEVLPKSEGYSVILVVVDKLTKFAYFISMKHPYTTVTVAHLFMDHIVNCMVYLAALLVIETKSLLVHSGNNCSSPTRLI